LLIHWSGSYNSGAISLATTGGSEQVVPGQTWPLDEPLVNMEVPATHHPAPIPAVGQRPQQPAV